MLRGELIESPPQNDTVQYYDDRISGKILTVVENLEVRMQKRAAPERHSGSLDQRLLAAAVEVFLEKGFSAASVDEIARRAKASKLTFYNHYGNKEALFEAVIHRQNAELVEIIEGISPGPGPLQAFLESVAHRLYTALLKGDTVKLVRLLHAEANRFPQMGNVFNAAGPARAIKVLAREMEAQMACGSLRKSDPLLAAEHFIHLALGELTRRMTLGVRPLPSKAEISKRIASGIDIFMRAYAA